ncbi:hypothetical protein N7451_011441 [Penicillium sp. IBT 35674x]|nr:hypothetical protein N7451_011441 [Penicillium sp. IBT 35674x]
MYDPEPHSSSKQGQNLFSDREEDFSKWQEEPFAEQRLLHCERGEQGPRFHAETATRSGCVAAVSVGAIIALLCFISGIFIIVTNETTLGSRCSISASGQEALTLAINVVLTFCIDGMMFVHSVSLRWTLYHEERLEYNTNVRLFTSSQKPGPNSWYINSMALFCLVLSYGSSSILLVYDEAPLSHKMADATGPRPPLINATALVALGMGLGGQAAIAPRYKKPE